MPEMSDVFLERMYQLTLWDGLLIQEANNPICHMVADYGEMGLKLMEGAKITPMRLVELWEQSEHDTLTFFCKLYDLYYESKLPSWARSR